MAKDEDKEQQEASPEKSGKGNMKIIIIAVLAAVLLSGGMVGATMYFMAGMDDEKSTDVEVTEDGEEAVEEIPVEPPQYHSMDPKFVVSFRDQRNARFMQFSLEVMARNKEVIDLIKEHSPAVRSSLLMLFDSQSYEEMSTREGKQQLLKDVVLDINSTLKKVTGEEELVAEFEAAYFTSFVIQ